MARSISSASARRARSSASSRDGAGREDSLWPGSFQSAISTFVIQIQLGEQAGGVQQVADEPAYRPWKFFDERRGRDDLVVARQVGLLIDVNHFQFAVVFQFGFAQLTDAQDGLARSGRGPRDVQSQDVFARGPGARDFSKACVARLVLFVFTGVRLG